MRMRFHICHAFSCKAEYAAVRKKGKVVTMGCGCKKDTPEVLDESIEFDSFESNVPEEISVDEAKEQEEVAEELRG